MSMTDQAIPAYPRASARYLVLNTGRRAAARITALTPIVAAYEADLSIPVPGSEWGRADAHGNRTVSVYGDRELVTRLVRQILPALIERMEADAAGAQQQLNEHLRRRAQREELAPGDLPAERRIWRREYLAAWGAAYADRARALLACTAPDSRPGWAADLAPADPAEAPDPVTEARRAVDGIAWMEFATEVNGPVSTARARSADYIAACAAAGLDPVTGAEPVPDPYEPRANSLVEVGEVTGDNECSRLAIILANAGEKGETRAKALAPVIRALGVEVYRWESDRWGQYSTTVNAPRPVLQLLRERLGAILARAESAARAAVREVYGPFVERRPFSAWQRAAARSGWGEEFVIGYCEAYAERISMALVGRADAARAGASPERAGATHDAQGTAYDLNEAGRRFGKAEADRLAAGEFAGYPAELGYRRAPARAASVLVTSATSGAELTDGASWVKVADTEDAGALRIRALVPVLATCRTRLASIQRDYDGWNDRRADRASLEGHPQLTALAARTVTELVAQMDRSAARAGRRDRVDEAERRGWIEAYRTGWGQAFAARLSAALAHAADARTELPDPAAGPAYRAALDVDEVAAEQFHHLAAQVAAVTDPAGLLRQTVWHLEIDPSPCYPAAHRSRAALSIARAYGLAADYPDVPARPGPFGQPRDVIRLCGPEALVDAVVGALSDLFARADAVVTAHLPALERELDQRRSTRHKASARDAARAAWSGSVAAQFLSAYAQRIEAVRAGDPAARRRGARAGDLDTRVALAAVDGLAPDEFAAAAVLCGAAQTALDTAWRAGLPEPEACGPRPRLVIVPCSRTKLDHPAPAAALYAGSFAKAAFKAAGTLRTTDPGTRVAVLSARHGLITDLDQVIEPYEMTIGDPGAISPAQLRRQAAAAGLADAQVTILAGRRYATLATAVWPDAETPLAGAGGIGYQLQRLSRIAAGQPATASAA